MPHARRLRAALHLLPCLMFAHGAGADSLVLEPAQDTTLFALHPTHGNGAGTNLFIGALGANGAGLPQRGLMRFDLAGLPPGAQITNVTLRFTITLASPGAGASDPVNLHRVTNSWGEGSASSGAAGQGAPASAADATWTSRFFRNPTGGDPSIPWAAQGGDFVAAPSGSTNVGLAGTYTIPSSTQLIADVQSWVDAPATNHGWVLRGAESLQFSARGIATRESANAGDRPLLTVTYTPPPAPASVPVLPLIGSALLGFVLTAMSALVRTRRRLA